MTSLDPAEQANLDRERAISSQLLGIGQGQLGRIGANFDQPLDFSGLPRAPQANEGERARIEQAMFDRLEPQFQRDEERLRTRLANQGFSADAEGFRGAMGDFDRARNDARLAVTAAGGAEQSRLFGLESSARERALQEQMLQRNQPLNELSALLGTSGGVNLPAFSPTPTQGVAPADVLGAQGLAQQNALARFNAQNAQQQGLMSGLFGLGGAGLGGYMYGLGASDRRLKTDIRRVGTTDGGHAIYTFRFKSGGPVQMGVMAQDIEKVMPEAVVEIDGVKHVRYDLIA